MINMIYVILYRAAQHLPRVVNEDVQEHIGLFGWQVQWNYVLLYWHTVNIKLWKCIQQRPKSQSLFVWSLPAFKASAFALPWPTDRHAWTAVMAMAPGLHPEAGGWRRKNWHDFKEWTRDFWVMFGATRQQLGFWLAGIVRLLASDDASKFCSTC